MSIYTQLHLHNTSIFVRELYIPRELMLFQLWRDSYLRCPHRLERPESVHRLKFYISLIILKNNQKTIQKLIKTVTIIISRIPLPITLVNGVGTSSISGLYSIAA